MKKNILSILDVGDQLEPIIDLAIRLKREHKAGKPITYLPGKNLAMLFERASTRTRVSFEVGMSLLGGHALYLSQEEVGTGTRESPKDIALVISRYADVIMYRAIQEKNLQEFAAWATVPVINGLDILEHPCQILADLQTIKEKKGRLSGLYFTFIGDGDDNLTHSYMLGCAMAGMNVTVISPQKYWPKDYYIHTAKDIAARKGRTVTITEDLAAIAGSDIVATDTWISLWYEPERQERLQAMKNYTVTPAMMKKARPDAIFMHCMPVIYGEEVTMDVAFSPQSVIIDEAENRLWAQMALLIKLLRPDF
jgi:ornithine carbamoyltransferase